ncbi:MAG: HDOD domain-containing protein, partial [candidate division Zixibacteria bacterium]|nr:HDOD domain-containing protein [candidate division Zixibacteria bacterium]
ADELPAIRQRVERDHYSFEQAEREVVGYDHAELGAMVAERWNFPNDLVQAVRWHHEPNKAGADRQAVDIIHVADSLCVMQGIGIGHDGLSYRPCADSLQRLNVTGVIIETATSQILDSLAEIESIFTEMPAPVGVGR